MSLINGAGAVQVLNIFRAGKIMKNTEFNTPCKQGYLERTIKAILLIGLTASIYITSFSAVAECTPFDPLSLPIDRHRGSNWTYEIDASLPTGSTLTQLIIEASNKPVNSFTCTGDAPIVRYESGFPYSGDDIYQTGIPGIGMKITASPYGNLPMDITRERYPGYDYFITDYYYVYIIKLIKTGYIPAGGQIFGYPLLRSYLINYENTPFTSSSLTQPLNIILKRPTCSINTPNFSANLGEVSISDFNTDGRTLPKQFSIDLNCEGGTKSADIYVTLTDANNPTNITSRLDLSPDSTAQGIALEVNNRFGVVNFGPDVEGLGNPGQWNDGSTAAGSYSIPLSVNYVRLPGPIKGGSANSGVTYTLNYD